MDLPFVKLFGIENLDDKAIYGPGNETRIELDKRTTALIPLYSLYIVGYDNI